MVTLKWLMLTDVSRYHPSLAVLGNIVTRVLRGIMVPFANWLDRVGLLAPRCSDYGERLDELHVEQENKFNHLFNQLWTARNSIEPPRPRVRSNSADWPAPRPRAPIPPLPRALLSPHMIRNLYNGLFVFTHLSGPRLHLYTICRLHVSPPKSTA